jgi:hypothetical protein
VTPLSLSLARFSIGLDINSTTNLPSQTQMFKLAMNRKFVRAAKAVRDELLAAGFKTDSDVRATPSLDWICSWMLGRSV